MRVVVAGGTGHIGTYLVPRLVRAGHEVVCISRGASTPYVDDAAWASVERVVADREAPDFGACVAGLDADAVIDLICFTPESARQLVEAVRGRIRHLVHCGTMWVHGYPVEVPVTEEAPRRPLPPYELEDAEGLDPYLLTDYGGAKAEIEAYLLEESRGHGLPATALHPGHLVGPGHEPVNPQGNMNTGVFETLARGEELALPNVGLETLHHVHADDVAQAFQRVLERPEASVGESFHVVSPAALTMRGYAESVAGWFGQEARLRFLPWDEWRRTVSAADAAMTWDHVAHSPCGSIAKAQRLLGYEPRYSSLDAVRESVAWLARNGVLSVPALE